METNTTNINTTDFTFPWPGVAQPVLKGQLDHLSHLGYDGPAPKTSREANSMIEDLLPALPDEPNTITYNEDDELNEDGFTWGEINYARMMHLRKKEGQEQW